jgi:hypothetical protein
MKIRLLIWIAVGAIYASTLVIVALVFHHGDLFFFINLGPPIASSAVPMRMGYDGQFAYSIGCDLMNATPHLDVPAYRFQRILYPLMAWLLAFGQAEWVPLTLVLVNIIGVALGTGAFAELLRAEGAPSWTPLLFFAVGAKL